MLDDSQPKKESAIERLERDLYDPRKKRTERPRRRLHGPRPDLKKDFRDDEYSKLLKAREKFKLPSSFFKKMFFAVLIFFAATVTIAVVSVYEGKKNVSEELIAMEIKGKPFIEGGETLELKVQIQNFNKQDLQLPDLILTYPKDSSENAEKVIMRRSLPDLPQGKEVNEDFNITLFGQVGDMRVIEATLEYRIPGSTSIFLKKVSQEVLISSTPTNVIIDAPSEIVRNQEITFAVNVSSNSNKPVNNTLLKLSYPRGFEFIRSNRTPDAGNNIWYFDSLGKEARRIEVTGRLAGFENQAQSFSLEFGRQNQINKNEIETIFNKLSHTVDIQKSFVDASFRVNGSSETESSVRGGGDIAVVISYKNTLEVPLQDINMKVNVSGDLFDNKKLNLQDGFYNSSAGAIIFDQTTSDKLKVLEPGRSGEFRFTVYTKDLVGPQGVLKNPFVDFSVDISGTRENGKTEQAFSIARHRVKANSDFSVKPRVEFYDGPFQNAGPMPPRVNVPTTYTLVFQVSNSSNEVREGELSTTLPPSVNWLNTVAPSVERTNVSFDQVTRKLVWKLGTVKGGVGVENITPRQLSVQVQVIPSAIQIGEAIPLTNEISLTGKDVFTDTTLNYKKTPVANRLEDRTKPGSDGRVVN